MNLQEIKSTPKSVEKSLLYLWEDRTLFFSSYSLPLRSIQTAADLLVVYFEGTSRLEMFSGMETPHRCVLIKAGYQLNILPDNGPNTSIAIVYLDPFGRDFNVLRQQMEKVNDFVYVKHRREEQIIARLNSIRCANFSSIDAHRELTKIINWDLPARNFQQEIDPRIAKVVELIKHTASQNLTLDQLASSVYLSSSRLCKLFKQQLGIPIRRYRLWHRIYICSSAYANGHSLLDSSLMAGFSSQSHYTTAFVKLVGLSPTDVLCKNTYFNVVTADLAKGPFAALQQT